MINNTNADDRVRYITCLQKEFTMRELSIRDFPHFVGFDRLFDELRTSTPTAGTFPPYDVIQEDENHYSIELALAGYNEEDLTVSQDRDTLVIEGSKDDAEVNYLHKGISTRKFYRTFTLAEHVFVKGAKYEAGLLKVELEREVPEELQPRQIEIQSSKRLK